MSKYGGYVLIAIGVLVLIYRFDIIIEIFRGTSKIPYFHLLTPIVLIVVGVIVILIILKKEKSKKENK